VSRQKALETTMEKTTILIVDDELMVRRVLHDALAKHGYHVELAESGMASLNRLRWPGIDLLLLDLNLGDIDGVQVMQEARRRWPNLPIVMLTANGSLPSAIAAVRCGAADYLLKPISVEGLRACVARVLDAYRDDRARSERLRAMYSQMQELLAHEGLLEKHSTMPREVYHGGPLQIDTQQHSVVMDGLPMEMTPSEFAILRELLMQPGAAVPCTRLVQALNTIVEDEEEARQLIRPHIARLRRKLEIDPQHPRYLISVWGVGYRWAAESG
jgi:two-component system KDP operon response regulator KdpE